MTHTQTTYTNYNALRADKKGARPADVGALASVFEKSAAELKRPKLLKCKQTLQIATFNVHRSPNSHGENTAKPTKKRQTNSDHQTL